MSITLELTDEEEATLRQAAKRAGVDVAQYVKGAALEAFRRATDDWLVWERAGLLAATEACDTLLESGIGYVYGRDGSVFRRLPDGTEEQVSSTAP